jgi:hypothetical protein
VTGTPTPVNWRTTSPTISYAEMQCGYPPQFTLMPTRSAGSKKRRHASGVVAAPVSVRMPRAIISRTASSFAAPVEISTDFADVTDTTRPGYGPGMPGDAAGAYFDTTRRAGRPG